MSDLRQNFTIASQNGASSGAGAGPVVGYVDGAIGGPDKAASLVALFPNVQFVNVGEAWPERPPGRLTALIVGADAAEVEGVISRLEAQARELPVIVALRHADVAATRRIMRAGAADILTWPVSEAALALSLERLLARGDMANPRAASGRIIGFLKAGGGVGATALGTQLAAILAHRTDDGGVCFADLDLQFGQGALYLDLADAMTLTDILGGGGALEEAPLASAIARHSSGARMLGAPREMTPMETLTPHDVDGLTRALRRDFAISILDLPTVWTAWTNQALHQCDRIIMVTQLSVPHINLVKRQLRVMATQGLDTGAVTLVCNQLSAEQQSVLPLKTAEKALGRAFDILIPEDRRLMNDAIAQGREISTVRAGSKLEKAIVDLANVIVPVAASQPKTRKRLWS